MAKKKTSAVAKTPSAAKLRAQITTGTQKAASLKHEGARAKTASSRKHIATRRRPAKGGAA